MKQRDYYVTPPSGKIMRFLWQAAGGDRHILERSTYSDQVKYMCLGGIVFATGAMAGLSGGYAFYTIFSPKAADVLSKTKTTVENADYIPTDPTTVIISIVFGVIWGLMIFNLDRFIVASTGKGDGTENITWGELKGALPRILMGTIIALTISKPIEIRMFKTEIDLAVHQEQQKKKDVGIELASKNFEKKVAEAKQKLGKLQTEIDAKEAAVANLRDEIRKEITGANGNGAAYGPRANELERLADTQEAQLKELKNDPLYVSTLADIKDLELNKKADIAAAEQKAATLDGLLIRIQKAHEIAGFWISLFITLLFLAIELTPIFFKLMLTKTPYDYLAENRDELIRAENGIEVRYDYYKDKEGLERHLIINHEADRLTFEKIKVTEIQKELTEYAIAKYKEKEKEKIDANLEDYIQKIKPNELPA
jgi:hypothetical protein